MNSTIFLNYLPYAWSNLLLLFIFFIATIIIFKKHKFSYGFLAFLFLFFLNIIGVTYHSMDNLVKTNQELEPFYQTLRYLSFSGLGIASFFIEMAVIERINFYKIYKSYQDNLSNVIISYLPFFIAFKLFIFQIYNLYIYLYFKPLFLYAVIDYCLSLVTTIIVYFIWMRSIKKLDKNNKFEFYGILGYGLLILVSFPFQISETIQQLFPYNKGLIHYNDLGAVE